MKNHKKISFILIPAFVLFVVNIAKANIELEVPFPGMEGGVSDLSEYIKILYNYGIYAASVMAVIMISINGFKWVAAGGNQSTIGKAKSGVFTAIIGLFLLFGSYMMLNTVNSELTLLKMPEIDYIDPNDLNEGLILNEKTLEYLEKANIVSDQKIACGMGVEGNNFCIAQNPTWTCIRGICQLRSLDGGWCDNGSTPDSSDCMTGLTCVQGYDNAYPRCRNLSCAGKKKWDECEIVLSMAVGENLGTYLSPGYCSASTIANTSYDNKHNIRSCQLCREKGDRCYEDEQCVTKGNSNGKCGKGHGGNCKKGFCE